MVRAILRSAGYWLLVAALLVLGVLTIPEDQQAVAERARKVIPSWLAHNWLPLFLLSAAFALGTLLLVLPAQERRFQRRLRKELKRSTEPGSFREVNAEQALEYLLHESAWGWRQYRRLNFWEMVAPHHLDELRRVARDGDLRTTGEDSGKPVHARTVGISRTYWENARINESSLSNSRYGVRTEVMEMSRPGHFNLHLDRLSVSEDDMYECWPRASATTRVRSIIFVWLKHHWYSWGPRAIWEKVIRYRRRRNAGL